MMWWNGFGWMGGWGGFGGPGFFGGFGGWIMIIFVILIVLLIFGLARGWRWGWGGGCHSVSHSGHDALDIARERYARGEISADEFEKIKKNLS